MTIHTPVGLTFFLSSPFFVAKKCALLPRASTTPVTTSSQRNYDTLMQK
jgi:hypothetical protein